jgi:integrase
VPRTVRNANLETRTARARLKGERFHWQGVTQGLALGYRRAKLGFGTWTLRALEPQAAKYTTHRLGRADDLEEADGREVLTYHQAADRARVLAAEARGGAGAVAAGPYSVADAARDYLEWFRVQRKSYAATKTVIDAHILPKLGRRVVAQLDKRELERWHQALAATPARTRAKREAKAPTFRAQDLSDPAVARRRRASANRILSVLRAMLNQAWRDGRVPTDSAWRRVSPFKNASEPLVRYLEPAEASRLVNASPADLRALVRGALMTGCRYGELVALRVQDFRADSQSVYVHESKSGRPRHVPLSAEGLAFFSELAAGRGGAATMFLRAGKPWGKNHQVRELACACTRAKIAPAVSFHVLRHTYGSWLAMRGVALQVIAEVLGHSDTRITQKHYGHLAPSYVAQVIRDNLPAIAPARGKVQALVPRTSRQGPRTRVHGA